MKPIFLITDTKSPQGLLAQTNLKQVAEADIDLRWIPLSSFLNNDQVDMGYADKPATFVFDAHLMNEEDLLMGLLRFPYQVNSQSRIYLRNFHALNSNYGVIRNLLTAAPRGVPHFQLFNPLKQVMPSRCSSYACTPGYLAPLIGFVLDAATHYGELDVDHLDKITKVKSGHVALRFRWGAKIDVRVLADKERDNGYCMGDGALRHINPEVNALALIDLISNPEAYEPEANQLLDALYMYKLLTE